MLSSLRQAKINWAESEVGAVSRFTRFTCEIGIARGFSSHFLSGVSWVFLWKPLLMATTFYNLFKPLTFLVSNAHFWLWHRCFLRVSPKPSSFGCIFLLWHRCFPLDFTGALFFVPSRDSAFSAILFELCLYLWPIACFCKSLMLNISFGCCRHSVSNTFVQLTEGRSARDQPKQPPAKKKRKNHPPNKKPTTNQPQKKPARA